MLGKIKDIEPHTNKEGNEIRNSANVYVYIKPLSSPAEPLDDIVRSLNQFYQLNTNGYRGSITKERELPDKYSYNDDKLAWICKVFGEQGADRGNIRITPRAIGEEHGSFYQRFWVDFFLDSRKRSEKHCKDYIEFVKES